MLLFVIFAFSFLFRAAIVFHNPYPPSSDIGLHGSIINLILDKGTLPDWNPYHMGGETLATPPGFHFFVSTLILLTGMDLILAEVITAAFYSSIIVFPAYIVSKRIWKNSNAALFASFFAAVSALSLEMISWGGYTNVVSLALIITIFYLFIKDIENPKLTHLVVGSILFGSLIITHSFSLFVVFPILAVYLVLLLIGKHKQIPNLKIKSLLRFFVVSIVAGAVAVSPWILRVFGFYLGASSEGAATGGLDNKNLILTNRGVDIVILMLILVVVPAIFMFRTSRKRAFDNQTLFLIAWFLVPIVMTQAYLFGVVTDYSRFMYFIDFPGIILISAGLLYLFRYTGITIKRSNQIGWKKLKKTLPLTSFTAIIFVFMLVSPWSIFPEDAMKRAEYYSTVHEAEGATLEWIKNYTAEDSVLVADHLYGWWLGGIGERVTLSAAELEFLIYSHELEVAKSAQLLMDTNYYIDNGLVEVKEAAWFVRNKTFGIGVEAWNGKAYPMFSVYEDNIVLWYFYENATGMTQSGIGSLADMGIVGTPSMIQDENSVTTIIRYENELFTVNRIMSVKQGTNIVDLSYKIDVKHESTDLYYVNFPLYVGQGSLTINNASYSWLGFYYWDKVAGEIEFEGTTPDFIEYVEKDPRRIEILFREENPRTIDISMKIAVFDTEDLQWDKEVKKEYDAYSNSSKSLTTQEPISVWNYTDMLEEYNVSYVICREQKGYLKFSTDTKFRLLINTGDVAVFQVVK